MDDAQTWSNGHNKALQAARSGLLTYNEIAKAIGRERQTIWNWRKDDPAWAAALEEAINEGYDVLRQDALEAVSGSLRKANEAREWRPTDIDNAHKTLAQLDPQRWREVKRAEVDLRAEVLTSADRRRAALAVLATEAGDD